MRHQNHHHVVTHRDLFEPPHEPRLRPVEILVHSHVQCCHEVVDTDQLDSIPPDGVLRRIQKSLKFVCVVNGIVVVEVGPPAIPIVEPLYRLIREAVSFVAPSVAPCLYMFGPGALKVQPALEVVVDEFSRIGEYRTILLNCFGDYLRHES